MHTQTLIRIIPSIIIIMITGYILPWWSFTIITLIVGYTTHREKESIFYGFIIGFSSWFILLIYLFKNAGDDQLFSKISILIINKDQPFLLIIYSSLISGFIGLLSSWTGWQFNKR